MIEFRSDNTVSINQCYDGRKLTGTKFPSVLGLNPYCTPFETWCECTRMVKKPFAETKFTAAGRAVEPKQLEFLKNVYPQAIVKTPADVYGEDFKKKTNYDFFPGSTVFGGMWDGLLLDPSDSTHSPRAVIECKTSSKPGPPPIYQVLQAALYAHLLDVDHVCLCQTQLQREDYEAPESVEVSYKNTVCLWYQLSKLPSVFPWVQPFPVLIEEAAKWYEEHVVGGISPVYDPVKDADLLKLLKGKENGS